MPPEELMLKEERAKQLPYYEVVIPIPHILGTAERQALMLEALRTTDKPMLFTGFKAVKDNPVPYIKVELLEAKYKSCLTNPFQEFDDAYFAILGSGKIHPKKS